MASGSNSLYQWAASQLVLQLSSSALLLYVLYGRAKRPRRTSFLIRHSLDRRIDQSSRLTIPRPTTISITPHQPYRRTRGMHGSFLLPAKIVQTACLNRSLLRAT
jgi:hypothetical protein